MGKRTAILVLGLVAAAALTLWALRQPWRYRLHAGGAVRADLHAERNEVRMEGKWIPLPEVKPTKLQARVEAAMAEQTRMRIAVPAPSPTAK